MKKLLLLIIAFISLSQVHADEGMWIPMLLQKNQAEMQRMGMKISAKDIYDVNHGSLKDAIVQFGGGCTGEFVSEKGLLFTNHHCGYSQIVAHSTVEHNYLSNGFWAKNLEEEIPCPGLTVTLLVRMEDVTFQVLDGILPDMSEKERNDKIQSNIKKVTDKAVEGSHYTASVLSFYYGNQYFLFVDETFKDVRLVGAPPSNIGKFGGDTDNWMWPRHTGDFSMFRVYAAPDNTPAGYSSGNVPYKPKKYLPISLSGIKKDDFTFVFGYPGRTQEYLVSEAVDLTVNTLNPARISLRDKRLEIYNAAMNRSVEERLMYSAQVASIANGWKKMIGESKGVKRLNGIEKKKKYEQEFLAWANQNSERKNKYAGLFPQFNEKYAKIRNIELSRLYFNEAAMASDIMQRAFQLYDFVSECADKSVQDSTINKEAQQFYADSKKYFANSYNLKKPVDKKIFMETMWMYYDRIDSQLLPPVFNTLKNKHKDGLKAYLSEAFDNSFLSSEEKTDKLFKDFKRKKGKDVSKDPVFDLVFQIWKFINENYPFSQLRNLNADVNGLYRVYMQGMMEMQPQWHFYPDANFTLRVAYGKIDGYTPADAVDYQYFTTIEGIMQKENPDIYDYVVEPKLKELYIRKDYGKYANKDGELPVAFIATNHTTGGNSGSPVLNAKGELIGINFDRCWEGTMSDIMYDPSQCRNIVLDIRYCLFVIDKFAGAGHLLKEMTIL